MNSIRRRSARLTASPWLFNWPKRRLVYVDLEAEPVVGNVQAPNIRNSISKSVGLRGSALSRGIVTDNLDIRNERNKRKMVQSTDSSDDDADFVTPGETFVHSSKSVSTGVNLCQSNLKKVMTISKNQMSECFNECEAVLLEEGSKSRKKCRTEEGLQTKKQVKSKTRVLRSSIKRQMKNNEKIIPSRQPLSRKLVLKRKTEKVGSEFTDGMTNIQDKVKKVRTYDGYIQKKFSPSILTDVLLSLSDSQAEWMRSTRFGEILNFRQSCYPHKLGYNAVKAFNNVDCALKLDAGNVKISESTVRSVLGFPNGTEVIKFDADSGARSVWCEQFAASLVTPKMVRDKMLGSRVVDNNFKWNFLVMIYNFFVEANQNRFLTQEILSFGGKIDECCNYNWCILIVEKVKKTHDYWAAKANRNFAGPLPLLIYLYASSVRNMATVYAPITFPAYIGWSDTLLRERQKYEENSKSFGVGKIVKLLDGRKDIHIEETIAGKDSGEGTEMTMRDIVNSGEAQIDEYMGNEKDNLNKEKHTIECSLMGPTEEIIENDGQNADGYVDMIIQYEPILNDGDNVEVVERNKDDGSNNNAPEVEFNGILSNHVPQNVPQEEKDADTVISVTEKGKKMMSATEYMLRYFGSKKTSDDIRVCKEKDMETAIMTSKNNLVSNAGIRVEQNTQERADEVIDNHFAEEPYLEGFEHNLEHLAFFYNKCIENFIDSLALFQDNPKLAELKNKYGQFFKCLVNQLLFLRVSLPVK